MQTKLSETTKQIGPARNMYDKRRLEESPEIAPFFDDIDAATASRAYYNTSHFPERAGSIIRSDYAKTLIQDKAQVLKDIEHAEKCGATVDPNYMEMVETWFQEHREGVKAKFIAYLHSHSNVASAFICGPANFPTARNQKRSQWADNHYENIGKYRHTSKRRILASILPYGDGSAIKTNDPDAVSKVENKISKLEAQRDRMKEINKTVRKFYKRSDKPEPGSETYKACIEALAALGISEQNAAELIKPDWRGCVPFASYSLTNLGAEIRRLKQRAQEVEQVKAVEINDEFPNGETATISDDGKIVIDFGYKPEEDVRTALKRRAFKWSRVRVAWVRKATANAIADYYRHIKPLLNGTEV